MTDFEKVYNFENLYRAYRKARRGKRWKGAAAKFEVNLLEALNLLSVQLQSHTYRLFALQHIQGLRTERTGCNVEQLQRQGCATCAL